MFSLFGQKKELATNRNKINHIPKPVVLLILDGLGISPIKEGNAVWQAKMPNFDYYQRNYPKTLLHASSNEVGLPYGQFGNSEVGHMNIGSGRVIYQELLRVNNEINSGNLYGNKVMSDIKKHLKKNNSSLHLMGLLSAGGVHSHIEHLLAIMEWCKKEKIQKIFLHAFTDGRDSHPNSAEEFIRLVEEKKKELGIDLEIASISGRYFAMDRDKHWSRTQKAYNAIIGKSKNVNENASEAIKESYEEKKTDEFIEPLMIVSDKKPIGAIKDGDAVLFFNIRSDRARQMTTVFADKNFKSFKTKRFKDFFLATLTNYEKKLEIPIVFPEETIINTLTEILSLHHKKQLHIAETEKYAHVTYFFSGGKEKPFPGEKRFIIQSPSVSTFDKKPEMSAQEITEKVIDEIKKDNLDFIVLNFANPDMLAHTGNIKATINGLEFLDIKIKEIIDFVLEKNGAVFITSDHGNAEMMINPETGKPDTEHNIFPVPFLLIANDLKKKKQGDGYKEIIIEASGALCDIAPTILDVMKIKQPEEMTGISLLNTLR